MALSWLIPLYYAPCLYPTYFHLKRIGASYKLCEETSASELDSLMAVGSAQVGNIKITMVVLTQIYPYNVSSNTAFSCADTSHAECIHVLSMEQNLVFYFS